MTKKPVVPSRKAQDDAEQTLERYAREGGTDVALSFIDALEAVYRGVGEHPGIGSPRYAHELGIPGLRHRRLKGFPHLVFYLEAKAQINVWRVLDARRDIPAWLSDEDEARSPSGLEQIDDDFDLPEDPAPGPIDF